MKNLKLKICRHGTGLTQHADPSDTIWRTLDDRGMDVDRDTAAKLSPQTLKLLDYLNAYDGDFSKDEPQIGIAHVEHANVSESCALAWSRFRRPNIYASRRGTFDLAIGLRHGERPSAISTQAADRLAPTLSRAMHAFYSTVPGPAIETPEEQSAREQSERDAQSAADREHAALAAARAKQERHEQAVAGMASAIGVDAHRAESVLQILKQYFGLSAL